MTPIASARLHRVHRQRFLVSYYVLCSRSCDQRVITFIMNKVTAAVPVASQGKKKPAKKPVAAKVKPSHPKTSDMVNAAIKELKERGGSSLQAIKKYISANYNVDAEKMAPFIRNYLKTAVTSGSLVQTKGKGASGSFKLVAGEGKGSGKKKTVSPKVKEAKPKKVKTAPKKSGDVKKSPKSGGKTVKGKPSTPSKMKKAKKVPTKKPKAPKPKTVGKAKPKTVKKAATGGSKKN